jgi:two-component system, chemotaxis family, chemotaxis protein CheY
MKRCLIADPSDVIRKIARTYLEQSSCATVEAEDADSALDIMLAGSVSVVLLDWCLPGRTTIEILSALRFSGIEQRPLIVYMTSENDPADIRKALAAGADTYLIKPFDQSSFFEAMSNAGVASPGHAPRAPSPAPFGRGRPHHASY